MPAPSSGAVNKKLCQCDMTAVQKTVVKEGPNQGRTFWVCPNSEKARCKYFEWDDEPGGGGGGGFNSNYDNDRFMTTRNGQDTQSTGDCFKVWEPADAWLFY